MTTPKIGDLEIPGLFAIKTLSELRGYSIDANKSAMALINKAKAENRNLTEAEMREYDNFNLQIEHLAPEIEKATRLEEKRKADAAAYIHGTSDKGEQKELSRFSLIKTIQELSRGGNLSGFEAEMHQEAQKEARDAGVQLEGFGIPRKIFQRKTEKRDITIADTSGGDTIGSEVSGYVDYLWDYLVFDKMGVDKYTNLKGNIKVPKVTTAAAATFKATQNVAATETSPVYDYLDLQPNVLAATIDVDKQLIMQSSIDIEMKLKEMLVKAIAIKFENQVLNDTSTNWVGLLAGVTSNVISLGTTATGAAPTWANICAVEGLVDNQNALYGTLGYLGSGKGASLLKQTERSTSSGRYLLDSQYDFMSKVVANIANGYPFWVSNALVNNVTRGTSTANTNILFGNWADLIFATWGPAFDIIVNPWTKSKEGIIELTIHNFCDFAIKNEKSFGKIQYVLTS